MIQMRTTRFFAFIDVMLLTKVLIWHRVSLCALNEKKVSITGKGKRKADMTSLRELPIGKTATIRSVGGEGALRQHFLDMGLIPKGEVTMVKYAPMGDPMELRIIAMN